MSVIVADPAGQVFVFSKGADTAIMPRIADQESDLYAKTNEHMEKFADEGMRTLVFAYKDLGNLQENLDEIEDEFFEENLELIGATGVEDML